MFSPASSISQHKSVRVVLSLIVAAMLASGCGTSTSEAASDNGKPIVVATTGIWADVLNQLDCGDAFQVESIIPDGGDPHNFEPSLADRGLLDGAALVVSNGLALEEGLIDVLETVAGTGVPWVEVSTLVDTIPFAEGAGHDDHDDEADDHDDHDDEADDHDDHDDEADDHDDHDEADDHDDHEHDGDDPHVWMDPSRVAAALPGLATALSANLDLDSGAIQECADQYRTELEELDDEIETLLDGVAASGRLLVTNHDSMGYFAERYDFEIIGTVLPSASGLAETNAGHLEELAHLLEETSVTAIFTDEQNSTADAEAVASSIEGVRLVSLLTGSLGTDDDTDTYAEMMRTNTQRIAEALQE